MLTPFKYGTNTKHEVNLCERLNLLDKRNAQLGSHKNEFHSFSKFSNWCKDPQEIDKLLKKLWKH